MSVIVCFVTRNSNAHECFTDYKVHKTWFSMFTTSVFSVYLGRAALLFLDLLSKWHRFCWDLFGIGPFAKGSFWMGPVWLEWVWPCPALTLNSIIGKHDRLLSENIDGNGLVQDCSNSNGVTTVLHYAIDMTEGFFLKRFFNPILKIT